MSIVQGLTVWKEKDENLSLLTIRGAEKDNTEVLTIAGFNKPIGVTEYE